MAYDENELVTEANLLGSQLRCFPESVQPRSFAGGTALLAKLQAVAFDTSTSLWVPWAQGGANGTGTISGFIWPDEVQLVSGSEVLGNVLLKGRIHFDDIPVLGGTAAQLATACETLRSSGYVIEGLPNFR